LPRRPLEPAELLGPAPELREEFGTQDDHFWQPSSSRKGNPLLAGASPEQSPNSRTIAAMQNEALTQELSRFEAQCLAGAIDLDDDDNDENDDSIRAKELAARTDKVLPPEEDNLLEKIKDESLRRQLLELGELDFFRSEMGESLLQSYARSAARQPA